MLYYETLILKKFKWSIEVILHGGIKQMIHSGGYAVSSGDLSTNQILSSFTKIYILSKSELVDNH